MVALEVKDVSINVKNGSVNVAGYDGLEMRRVATSRDIEASICCRVDESAVGELTNLMANGGRDLEIIVRRRAPRPQDVQSAAPPFVESTARWSGAPKTKKAVNSDAPETQPEPEEPTTAQTVEEFGSWG